jgi:hypothetical protein
MKFLDVPQSGSIADRTHSHNRAGQYTRNRRSPTQPVGTGRRAILRNHFGTASSAWAGLTYSQQAAWQAYADSHPITDALGQSIKLTGHQMFVAVNTQLLNCGSVIETDPPSSAVVFAVGATTITGVMPTGLVVTPEGNGSGDDFLLIAWSKPQSSGVSFCKTFWQETALAGNASAAHNSESAYEAQFGVPPTGSRVFYKLTPVNEFGVTGVPVIGFVTIS